MQLMHAGTISHPFWWPIPSNMSHVVGCMTSNVSWFMWIPISFFLSCGFTPISHQVSLIVDSCWWFATLLFLFHRFWSTPNNIKFPHMIYVLPHYLCQSGFVSVSFRVSKPIGSSSLSTSNDIKWQCWRYTSFSDRPILILLLTYPHEISAGSSRAIPLYIIDFQNVPHTNCDISNGLRFLSIHIYIDIS